MREAVIIDHNTTIYFAVGADPAEAKTRYLDRVNQKNKIRED